MKKILITVICIAVLAHPIEAASFPLDERQNEVPIVLDAFIMRPIGFTLMLAGLGLFACGVVCPPFVLLWRPSEIDKPFKTLFLNSAHFVFVDPLGYHPNRSKAVRKGEIPMDTHRPSVPTVVPTSPQRGEEIP